MYIYIPNHINKYIYNAIIGRNRKERIIKHKTLLDDFALISHSNQWLLCSLLYDKHWTVTLGCQILPIPGHQCTKSMAITHHIYRKDNKKWTYCFSKHAVAVGLWQCYSAARRRQTVLHIVLSRKFTSSTCQKSETAADRLKTAFPSMDWYR